MDFGIRGRKAVVCGASKGLGRGCAAALACLTLLVNTTAMAGRLIARAITRRDDRFRLFSDFGPRWVGGPLGQAGVQMSYWGMQIRDRMEERRGSS